MREFWVLLRKTKRMKTWKIGAYVSSPSLRVASFRLKQCMEIYPNLEWKAVYYAPCSKYEEFTIQKP